MRVMWPNKPSLSDKLNKSFEELRRLNRASLAEIRDVWVQSWSWYAEENVETDLITNSVLNAVPGR